MIRLTASKDGGDEWTLTVEAAFTKGHETLVYACDFRKEWSEENQRTSSAKVSLAANGSEKGAGNGIMKVSGDVGKYTVISTSFYDRQICVWNWTDEERRKAKTTSL